MTALEARERALSIMSENDQDQIADFDIDLDISVDNGKLNFIYYKPLNPRVIEHFEKKGFKISLIQTGMNEHGYNVEY